MKEVIGSLVFATFIAGKLVGVFAAWSWWWVLFPAVPFIGEILIRVVR